jgi:serine/threonine protein kinase
MDDRSTLASALTGRYDIDREIGRGGMATVYVAEDVRHARRVAIKVLHPELSAVIGVERFLAEIKTTAALQHPHILPLFDSGSADGLLYYVMPFVEGETLRARLEILLLWSPSCHDARLSRNSAARLRSCFPRRCWIASISARGMRCTSSRRVKAC